MSKLFPNFRKPQIKIQMPAINSPELKLLSRFDLHFISITGLKILAIISMLTDHIGVALFPDVQLLRIIGRIAMPLFAFCIAEGYIHTRNKLHYLARLCIFAAISEVPYDLMNYGHIEFENQNILFTFAIAVLTLVTFEALRKEKRENRIIFTFLVSFLAFGIGGEYHVLAVGLVFIFYMLQAYSTVFKTFAGIFYSFFFFDSSIYGFSLLGFVPILFYNGKRGKGLKWLFYIFYPAHMLILYLLSIFF